MPEFIAMLGSAPGPKSLGQTPTYSYMGRMPDFSYQSIAREGDLRGLGALPVTIGFPTFLETANTTSFASHTLVMDAVKAAYDLVREIGADPAAITKTIDIATGTNQVKAFGAWAVLWMKKHSREADLKEMASAKSGDDFARAVISQYEKFRPTIALGKTAAANQAAIAAKRINDNVFTTAADLSCAMTGCADLHFGALFAAAMGAQNALDNATKRKEAVEAFKAPMEFAADGVLIDAVPAADKVFPTPFILPHHLDVGLKVIGGAAILFLGYNLISKK